MKLDPTWSPKERKRQIRAWAERRQREIWAAQSQKPKVIIDLRNGFFQTNY